MPETSHLKSKTQSPPALKLIEFGMASTAMAFQDQHYIYDGSQTSDDTGLSIGAHESAWLADLVGPMSSNKLKPPPHS